MLKERLIPHIRIFYLFLIAAAMFGLLYALQLVGIGLELIRPDLVRSLHISLMLYGFPTVMMALLPFALFDKEGVMDKEAWGYLEKFFWLWYLFLVLMLFSLLYGATRGLPFYDFPYELNFILAAAGIFYIIAIFKAIRNYKTKPLWVKVSLVAVSVSPLALLVLMNPEYGQVEKMLLGPHGDNTLGMSFALMVIYYLALKLASPKQHLKTRWHILWIIPLGFYVLSVLYRSFVSSLSYEQEWFLQYLTLLYIPLLYRWWKDAGVRVRENMALFLSMAAFVFADIEGNILFIPHLRELFHRNDLVVGHAHVAVGIGFLFLAFAIIDRYWSLGRKHYLYIAGMLTLMSAVLSLSGFEQAGFGQMHTETLWYLRAFFGFLVLAGFLRVKDLYRPVVTLLRQRTLDKERLYHLAGFASDGLGGLMLLLFAPLLYGMIGQPFSPGYQQIVFGFVTAVGMMHLMALIYPDDARAYANATVIARVLTAAGFFALYKTGQLGQIAGAIAAVDLAFAGVYLFYIKERK